MEQMLPQEEQGLSNTIEWIRLAGLQSATVTEHTELSIRLERGAPGNLKKNIAIGFEVECGELANLNELLEKASESQLKVKLVAGGQFPCLTGLGRIGYSDRVTLQHQPGQPMLVVTRGRFGRYSLERILKDVHQHLISSETNLRIVQIWMGEGDVDGKRYCSEIEEYRWTMSQHFFTNSGNKQISSSFQRSRNLFVFVGQTGIVEAVIHDDSILTKTFIDESLSKLENGVPLSKDIQNQSLGSLKDNGGCLWNKYQNIFEILARDTGQWEHSSLSLTTERKRKHSRVGSQELISKLNIVLVTNATEESFCKKYVRNLVQLLNQGEYDFSVVAPRVDQQFQFHLTEEKVRQLLHRHQLEDNIQIHEKYSINLIGQSKWQQTRRYCVAKCVYDGRPETMRKGEEFLNDLRQYRKKTLVPQEGLSTQLELPFRVVDAPFIGIRQLMDYQTGEMRSIKPQAGIVQIILLLNSQWLCREWNCVLYFAQAVSRNARLAQLHLIYISLGTPRILRQFTEGKYKSTHVYTADLSTNNDVKAACVSNRYTVVVDAMGQMVGLGRVRSIEDVEALILDPRAHDRGVSKQFARKLETLPENPIFKQVQAALKYIPNDSKACLTYICNRSIDSSQGVVIEPVLELSMKRSDLHRITPLLNLLKDGNWLERDFKLTATLPKGKSCADCRSSLTLPYYYFYSSKVHRCRACTERSNPHSLEKLLRYPVMESSVLLFTFTDSEVNPSLLSTSRIPEEEFECGALDFICSNCNMQSPTDISYECLECDRFAPSTFCNVCFAAYLGFNGRTNRSRAELKQNKHKRDHALLRRVYRLSQNLMM